MRHLLPILQALHEAGVRMVVVGGVAVVLQGHPRMTVDLDLAIDLDRGNVLLALRTLTQIGLVPRLPVPAEDFADPVIRQRWVDQRNLMVFSLHDPSDPRREVDIFASDPLPFQRLWDDATTVDVAGTPVRVASRQHLTKMKTGTGRPQDAADVQALRGLDEEDRA